jgi:hypothetical protein
MYQLEVIAFNIASIITAEKAGAHRIELCDNPGEGGTTPTAGPCLCGYFAYKDFNAIACVMNTKTVDSRWKDMAMLFLWALDKYL